MWAERLERDCTDDSATSRVTERENLHAEGRRVSEATASASASERASTSQEEESKVGRVSRQSARLITVS